MLKEYIEIMKNMKYIEERQLDHHINTMEAAIIKIASELGYEVKCPYDRFRFLLDIENKFSNKKIEHSRDWFDSFNSDYPETFCCYINKYSRYSKSDKEDFDNIYYMLNDCFNMIINKISKETNKSHLINIIHMARKAEDIYDAILDELISDIDSEKQNEIVEGQSYWLFRKIFNDDYYTESIAKLISDNCFGIYYNPGRVATKGGYKLPEVLHKLNQCRKEFEKSIENKYTLLYKDSFYTITLLRMLEFIKEKNSDKFEEFSKFYEYYKSKLIKLQKEMYIEIYKNRSSLLTDKDSDKYKFLTEYFVSDLWYHNKSDNDITIEWFYRELIKDIDLNGVDGLSDDEIDELKIFIFNSSLYSATNKYIHNKNKNKRGNYSSYLENIFGSDAELMKTKIFVYDVTSRPYKIDIDKYMKFYDNQFLSSAMNSDLITQENLSILIKFYIANYDIKILLDLMPEDLKEQTITYIMDNYDNLRYVEFENKFNIIEFIINNLNNINIDKNIIKDFIAKTFINYMGYGNYNDDEKVIRFYNLCKNFLSYKDKYELLLNKIFRLNEKSRNYITTSIADELYNIFNAKEVYESIIKETKFNFQKEMIREKLSEYSRSAFMKIVYQNEEVEIIKLPENIGILVKPINKLTERPGYYYINVMDNGYNKVYKVSAKKIELETLLKNYLEFVDSSYVHDWMLRSDCIVFERKEEYELLGEEANNIDLYIADNLSQDEKEQLTNRIASEVVEISSLFEVIDKKKQLKY